MIKSEDYTAMQYRVCARQSFNQIVQRRRSILSYNAAVSWVAPFKQFLFFTRASEYFVAGDYLCVCEFIVQLSHP